MLSRTIGSRVKPVREKPPLNVAGQPALPENTLPWERDLLAILREAIGCSVQQEKADIEVPS